MADYDYIGSNKPDGCMIGIASTEKVGFWGTTPCDQPASSDQAAVTTSITTTATTTNIETTVNSIITLLNQIRTSLVEVGIIKGEA
jgi:hypothetical protein